MKNFNMAIPILMYLLQLCLRLEHFKPHKATRHSTKYDIINDVKQFPTVYRRIYCRNFLKLSNEALQKQVQFANLLPREFKVLAYIDLLRSKLHWSLKTFKNGLWWMMKRTDTEKRKCCLNVFHSLTNLIHNLLLCKMKQYLCIHLCFSKKK